MVTGERIPLRVQRARSSLAKLLQGQDGLVGVGVGRDAAGRWILQVLVSSAACGAWNSCPDVHQGCLVTLGVSGAPRKLPLG
jgi:hypothetical protein